MSNIVEVHGERYRISRGIDISIPLMFNGAQPNAFGVEPAVSAPCRYGELIGDTRLGGSCNFERITLIPHCNGTHTECVGHITDDRISVRECLQDAFVPADLISVRPERTSDDDLIVTPKCLDQARLQRRLDDASKALIIRTLPNDTSKLTRVYEERPMPPYLSVEAMHMVVGSGFKHLLVDLPSIDRLEDGGRLENHRLFWNVEQGSREVTADTRIDSTITELIYVPDDVPDGRYLLNLQIAPFQADAAPSRPILFPLG